MGKMKKAICLALSFTLMFSFAGCNAKYTQGITAAQKTVYDTVKNKESDEMVRFNTSDSVLNGFINDYLHRHLRYDDYSISPGGVPVGDTVMFGKEWEGLELMWFDSTGRTVPNDRYEMLKGWIEQIPTDKFGYVWSGKINQASATVEPNAHFRQGWLFPEYDWGTIHGADCYGEEWNAVLMDDSPLLWRSGGSKGTVDTKMMPSDGLGVVNFTASQVDERLILESPAFTPVESLHGPFLNMDLRITDNNNFGLESDVEDILIQWKTTEDDTWDDTWSGAKTVSQKQWNTRPTETISPTFAQDMYFPMYLNDAWQNKHIKQLRVVIVPKTGKTLNVKTELNFVRLDYDTRQSSNVNLLLSAAKEYFKYTGDKEFLKNNINRFRGATEFLLNHLDGKSGLIDLNKFFIGHDGIGNQVGHGMGDSYWDIFAQPALNLYSNVMFYRALESMAYLERMAAAEGITVAMPTVTGTDNATPVPYDETADSLDALRETVKEKIQTTFWNEEKGRFHLGISPDGNMVDYGFIQFNLEVVSSGIASDEQAKQVMDWVSGKRIVEGDLAQGKVGEFGADTFGLTKTTDAQYGIYDFSFAPRTTTVENFTQYIFTWLKGNLGYGEQLQDGGTTLYLAYYDMMSRMRVYGADDVFIRLKEIQKWYLNVQAANGEADRFYRDYYDRFPTVSLQGNAGNGDSAGALGVDCEFIEAALLYCIMPFGFMGLDSQQKDVISVTPQMPSYLNYLEIENLMYRGVKYDMTVTDNAVMITNLRATSGNLDGKKLQVSLVEPDAKYYVLVDGNRTTDYTVVDGRVQVTVPMAKTVVSIAAK